MLTSRVCNTAKLAYDFGVRMDWCSTWTYLYSCHLVFTSNDSMFCQVEFVCFFFFVHFGTPCVAPFDISIRFTIVCLCAVQWFPTKMIDLIFLGKSHRVRVDRNQFPCQLNRYTFDELHFSTFIPDVIVTNRALADCVHLDVSVSIYPCVCLCVRTLTMRAHSFWTNSRKSLPVAF